jgi:hypothetical protein
MSPPDAPTTTLTRRTLLKSGLWGTVFVAAAGFGLSLQDTRLVPDAPSKLSVLSPKEYAVLVALSDRLCPALDATPSASELGIPAQLDRMLSFVPVEEQEGVKMALRLFEHPISGVLFGERTRPFTQLSPEDQDRVIVGWRDSKVGVRRTIYTALSGLVLALYWGHPRTWPTVGYQGPPDPAGLRKVYADNLVDLHALRASPEAKGG